MPSLLAESRRCPQGDLPPHDLDRHLKLIPPPPYNSHRTIAESSPHLPRTITVQSPFHHLTIAVPSPSHHLIPSR
eukprot:1015883-Rhodomonas_salina.1